MDFSVPPEFIQLAQQLDQVAATIRGYVTAEPTWATDSQAANEISEEQSYLALPMPHPVVHTLLTPIGGLGQVQDHLVAMAAVIRAENSIMALHTLLRPVLVGCANSRYVADPQISGRERLRRAMNIELGSCTEIMNLVGRASGDQLSKYDERRRKIASGGRALGFAVVNPEIKKTKHVWAPWHLGQPPPTEMRLVETLLESSEVPRIGLTLYRLLSAAVHAQPHTLQMFIHRESAVPSGIGHSQVPIRMSESNLATLLLVAVSAATLAVDSCVALFDWPADPWRVNVVPFFRHLQTLVDD